MFNVPKLSSNSSAPGVKYNIANPATATDVLTNDASIFSVMFYVSSNSIFDDFKFKIEHNKIVE